MKYSVLMSVYSKEKPEYLLQSMESIWAQTVPTDDFILVCDGPLTDELDAIVKQEQSNHFYELRVIRLKESAGLGKALAEGLKHCKYNIVARMDSDDISLPERCEKELECFQRMPELDIVSGTVIEFKDTPENKVGRRQVPKNQKDIIAFSRKRNPFNHPAVMFNKIAVLNAGSYNEDFHLFEDYYLWIRMLRSGSHAYNIQDPVLLMRTSGDLYFRRGGSKYAKDLISFHKWMYRSGWTKFGDYVFFAIPHAFICVMPNGIRKCIYSHLHS